VSKSLGIDICTALIGLHAFTGCDSVSAFAGKGKVSAYKLMRKQTIKTKYQQTFISLGQKWDLDKQVLDNLVMFVCTLYGAPTVENVNACRYKLFCAEIDSSLLPPWLDCLHKHAFRSNYQTAIWRKSLEACPVIPSPNGHGWIVNMSTEMPTIEIDWKMAFLRCQQF